MKTDVNGAPQAIGAGVSPKGSKPVTTLRRAGQLGLALINPFSDLAVIYRTGVQPTLGKLKLARELINRPTVVRDSLSWKEAVESAGVPVGRLQTTFKRIRALWWCLMAVPGALSIMLLLMMIATRFNLPSGTLVRAVTATLVLAALGGVGFVKVLVTNYRLWQLTAQRVSEEERGTFKNFLAENRWFRQVLTMGMAS